MRRLGGKPMIQWTVESAVQSGIFQDIQIWTDDPELHMYTAEHFPVRSYTRDPSADDEPDIAWVTVAVAKNPTADAFAILRPTSPFRDAGAIRRAWQRFQDEQPCDSLRAVQPVREHPGKMWRVVGDRMYPLFEAGDDNPTPLHSRPTQTLEPLYVQNASLEIAWSRVVRKTGTISGHRITPFIYPTLDVNTEADWDEAERRVGQLTHG